MNKGKSKPLADVVMVGSEIFLTVEEYENLHDVVSAAGELYEIAGDAEARPFPYATLKILERFAWQTLEAIGDRNGDTLSAHYHKLNEKGRCAR